MKNSEAMYPMDMAHGVVNLVRGARPRYDRHKMVVVMPNGYEVMFSRHKNSSNADMYRDGKKVASVRGLKSPEDALRWINSFSKSEEIDTGDRWLTEQEVRDVRDTMGLMVVRLRLFVRSMDNTMAAAQGLAEAGRRNHYDAADMYNAMQHWKGPLGKTYSAFADTRGYFYEIAKQYGVSTKSPKKRSPSKPIKSMTARQLVSGVDTIMSRMDMTMGIMANEAAKLLHDVDRTMRQDEVSEDDVKRLVKLFVEVRDDVSMNLFAAISGIARRLNALASASKDELVANTDMARSNLIERLGEYRSAL